MKTPTKYKKLFLDIKNKAKLNNVKITVSKNKTLPYPIGKFDCHGFFVINGGYPKGELGIATGDGIKEWIKILIHESCHMDQFIENDINWVHNFIYDETNNKIKESVDLLDEWIKGREMSSKLVTQLVDACLSVELDCERRAAEKIKKYNLDIDVEQYIQQANSYIYFYRFLEESRASYKKTPYQIKKVWSKMPKHFNNDYSTVPDEFKKLFSKLL